MRRGKAGAGAGRAPRKPAKLKPEATECGRAQTNSIVQRLDDFIHGRVELTSAQVTAALGLLKILPDLSDATVVHLTDEQLYSRIRELAQRLGLEHAGAPAASAPPERSEPSR